MESYNIVTRANQKRKNFRFKWLLISFNSFPLLQADFLFLHIYIYTGHVLAIRVLRYDVLHPRDEIRRFSSVRRMRPSLSARRDATFFVRAARCDPVPLSRRYKIIIDLFLPCLQGPYSANLTLRYFGR